MGIFSIIETFFFISLGITIILVALLVYHFKQRVSALEQKYESLFDIVTGVVKQLSNIQSVAPQPQFMGQPGGIYPPWISPEHLGNVNVSTEYPHQMFSGEHVQYNMQEESRINYSVEESEEEEEEDSDDESGDDEDSDDESGDDESQPEEAKVIVSDDEDESQAGVKIINLHMDEPSIHIEDFNPISLDETDELYELPTQDVQMDYSASLEQEEETPIVVKKMEDSLQEQPESTFVIEKASSSDLYKKMTLSNLKATVISKGLCSDPSKMKKNELLKLLEECE
jgi:hypothetical protein